MLSKKIYELQHPVYSAEVDNWRKYRSAYQGGQSFLDTYLQRFSTREEELDFTTRKKVSYVPAHAKSAISDIQNAIYQRLIEIERLGVPKSFTQVAEGSNGGVDKEGNSMDSFIGTVVLPELLSIGKVGIFIDREPRNGLQTRANLQAPPYLYTYEAENILSWSFKNGQLITVLLRDYIDEYDDTYGLITGQTEQYRLLTRTDSGIRVQIFNTEGVELPDKETFLDLQYIPFVIGEIKHSLMTDVADYQIALMNLASSDMVYAIHCNFPFYTEQYNPSTELFSKNAVARPNDTTAGAQHDDDLVNRSPEIRTGAAQGRRYAKGLDRPQFIHPSSEPLKASMEKQKELQKEIRLLINLALTNLDPQRASSDSKERDREGLENGLAYVGLQLRNIETQILTIWANYERYTGEISIKYPVNYSIKTDADRLTEAGEYIDRIDKVPSLTFKKKLLKIAVKITLGHKTTDTELDTMYKEIDEMQVIVQPELLLKQYEAGLVGGKLASTSSGFPESEIENAKADHAERLARIAAAQSKGGYNGVPDTQETDTEKVKRQAAVDPNLNDEGVKKVRGEGK
jgi:hypothetical protein